MVVIVMVMMEKSRKDGDENGVVKMVVMALVVL